MIPFLKWLLSRLSWQLAGLLTIAVLIGGCGRDEVKSYSVPKEQPSQSAEASLPPDHPDIAGAAGTPSLKWITPDGWKETPPGDMRVASFRITGQDGKQADVSVIPLPGEAGSDLSNVNRWRSQVEQEPVSEGELKTLAQPVEVAGQPATLYEQNGQNSAGGPTRILAVIQHRDGTAWFFKMTGDSQLVAQQKPVFVALLRSMQFASVESTPAQSASPGLMTDGGLPVGQTDISMPSPGDAAMTSSADRPRWVVPAEWKEAPAGQFLVAKYMVTGESGSQAAVNISSSAGNGGGVAANVNRWRKQLGLEALSDDELSNSVKTVSTGGGTATFVEMSGRDARSGQPASLVGAIVMQPGHAWFYKLMGDGTVVTAQKDTFTRFVQDVNY